MSNVVDLPPNKHDGVYKGFLHTEGGIQSILENGRKLEIEKDEYHLCSGVMESEKVYEFKDATNREILDKLFHDSNCIFEQGKSNFNDFIICRVVVLDKEKRDRTGTAKQLVNSLQSEKSCKVSSDSNQEDVNELGGNVSGEKETELNKLLDKKSKLESRLHDAKLKSNEVFNRIGFGAGMRKSKVSVSTTKEDEIKSKLDIVNKLIADIKGGSKKEIANDEINKIIRDLSTMKSGLKKYNESEYESGYSKLLTLNENDVLSELENYIKFQKDNAKYFASKESKANVDKWLDALIKLESDLKNDFSKSVSSEKQELIDLIELIKETLKDNPDDQDSKDSLELYEETLKEFSGKKEDIDFSFGSKKKEKFFIEEKGDIVFVNINSGKNKGGYIYNKSTGKLDSDNGERKDVKDYLILQGVISEKFEKGGNLTAEEAILNAPCINKKFKFVEASDYSKFENGGKVEVNKVSVYQTDFSGLNFSDLGGYFESLATDVIDLEDENVMLKSLSVFLFFKNPYDIRNSEKIYIDDVIGAIIPKKMEKDARVIFDKHYISYVAYSDSASDEAKIESIKKLAEINPDIILL